MKKPLQNLIKHLPKILAILCLFLTSITYAQKVTSDLVEKQLRQIYNKIPNPETSFETFLQSNRHVYEKKLNVNGINGAGAITNLTLATSCSKIVSFCSNGDFESGNFDNGLDTTQWLGAYGVWIPGSEPDPAVLTDGFLSGPLTSPAARHTIVSTGVDPITGFNLTASLLSTQALRLGNTGINNGTELIAKTITVTAAQTVFDFKYAVVFQDPNHIPSNQPAFSVRAVDCATGQELTGVCDLGNGSNRVISDAQNPFFQDTVNSIYGLIAYRDWSTAQIDLSAHIGKTVTIYFTNKDCSQSGHFGYTYLDDFCSTVVDTTCPPGSPFCPGLVRLDVSQVDTCGPGQICVKYALPRAGGQTGSITINLDIYQNGVNVKVATISSPVLSQDSSYCFSINPASLGIADSSGGFDFVVTGRFNIGSTSLAPKIIGNPPNGQVPGPNNDYNINCDGVTTQCCPGTNLVKNPGFEQGNTDFTSNYTYQPLVAVSSVLPGYYTVANSAQALTISPSWDVNCASGGNHLLVNGATGMTGDRKLVWRQDVPVEYGKKYKFCVNLKNLPQIGFDVKPNVIIRFVYRNAGVSIVDNISKIIDVPSGACNWDLIEKEISLLSVGSGSTTLTISILLDESGIGDGNDLAVDNISLIELKPVPLQELLFNLSFNNIGNNTFGIFADPLAPLGSGCTSNWTVSEVNANYRIRPATQVSNPTIWSNLDPNTFNGYVGTSVLGDTMLSGIFQLNRRYRIAYSRTCDCALTNTFAAIIDPVGSSGNLQRIRVINDQVVPGINTSSVAPDASISGNTATAIEDAGALKTAMNVYPNPTKGNLTVAFGKAGDNSKLVIYNTNGGVVKEVPVKSGNTRFDVNTSALPAGTYFIKLFSNNKIGGSKVFVKQ